MLPRPKSARAVKRRLTRDEILRLQRMLAACVLIAVKAASDPLYVVYLEKGTNASRVVRMGRYRNAVFTSIVQLYLMGLTKCLGVVANVGCCSVLDKAHGGLQRANLVSWPRGLLHAPVLNYWRILLRHLLGI